MLNQLLKFTLLSSILFWLKPRWRGLLALTVFVILVHVFHAEYLGYVELSENKKYLVASYFLKWLGLLAGLVIYYLFAVAGLRVAAGPQSRGEGISAQVAPGKSMNVQDDGFDFLRNKNELEGRAEKLLEGPDEANKPGPV